MTYPGVKMRLIGWAIALAAAGLTPAAAQTPPPSSPTPAAATQAAPAAAANQAAPAIVPKAEDATAPSDTADGEKEAEGGVALLEEIDED